MSGPEAQRDETLGRETSRPAENGHERSEQRWQRHRQSQSGTGGNRLDLQTGMQINSHYH